MPVSSLDREARSLSDAIADLLRLERPAGGASADSIDAALRRYECGGYLYGRWRTSGRLETLPAEWRQALAREHRKTAVDNLAALAEFRRIGRRLADEGVPFILLKGVAYLIDLYDDPAERHLTDIDFLIRRQDIDRLGRIFPQDGYDVVLSDREFQRFEIRARGRIGCNLEFHWWLGRPLRSRISQEDIWSRAVPVELEGAAALRLSPEDALLYHVAHQADHRFGPSLKWTIDLRQMLGRWSLNLDRLRARGDAWRLRVALCLALRHLEKLFPDATPSGLREAAAMGPVRRLLLDPYLSTDSVQLFAPADGLLSRLALPGLLIDRPIDVARQSLRVLVRPIAQLLGMGTRSALP